MSNLVIRKVRNRHKKATKAKRLTNKIQPTTLRMINVLGTLEIAANHLIQVPILSQVKKEIQATNLNRRNRATRTKRQTEILTAKNNRNRPASATMNPIRKTATHQEILIRHPIRIRIPNPETEVKAI